MALIAVISGRNQEGMVAQAAPDPLLEKLSLGVRDAHEWIEIRRGTAGDTEVALVFDAGGDDGAELMIRITGYRSDPGFRSVDVWCTIVYDGHTCEDVSYLDLDINWSDVEEIFHERYDMVEDDLRGPDDHILRSLRPIDSWLSRNRYYKPPPPPPEASPPGAEAPDGFVLGPAVR